LFDRAKCLECLQEEPRWCVPTQGYALAAKLIAQLSFEAEDNTKAGLYLEEAIYKLGWGDRECQTRANMLADMLGNWYKKWGNHREAEQLETRTTGLELKSYKYYGTLNLCNFFLGQSPADLGTKIQLTAVIR
jgi:hypothetical protein